MKTYCAFTQRTIWKLSLCCCVLCIGVPVFAQAPALVKAAAGAVSNVPGMAAAGIKVSGEMAGMGIMAGREPKILFPASDPTTFFQSFNPGVDVFERQLLVQQIKKVADQSLLKFNGVLPEFDLTIPRLLRQKYALDVANPQTLDVLGRLKQRSKKEMEPLWRRFALLSKNKERLVASYIRASGNSGMEHSLTRLVYLGDDAGLGKTPNPEEWGLIFETFLKPNNKWLTQSSLANIVRGGSMGTDGHISLSYDPELLLTFNSVEGFRRLDSLYANLLRCSTANPCFMRAQGNSIYLYSPDKQFWLRMGHHEVQSGRKLHLHLHHLYQDPSLGAKVTLNVNYVISFAQNRYLDLWNMNSAASRRMCTTSGCTFEKRFNYLITVPFKKMIDKGLVELY